MTGRRKALSYRTGVTGEARAAAYLESLGMRCAAQRWRGGGGEIDLIMEDGETLVFVEVKYRPAAPAGEGLLAVTADKRRRMVRAASAYLAEVQGFDCPVRFDVVEITAAGLRHVPDAFRPD